MRRFSGSAGLTSNVTEKNMLRAVVVCEGSLPRKLWASMFIWDVDRYHVVYRRSNPSPIESLITHAEYSPPHDGGQFDMPDACLTECPVLGKMTYQKMMSVQILNVLNNHFKSASLLAVAMVFKGKMNSQRKTSSGCVFLAETTCARTPMQPLTWVISVLREATSLTSASCSAGMG